MTTILNKIRIASALIAVLAFQPCAQLFGSDGGKPGSKRLRIELSSGLGFGNPDHLNLIGQADEVFHSILFYPLKPDWGYYRDESHVHYESIKRTFLPNLRLVYPVSGLFSISIGIQASKGQADSKVDYSFISKGDFFHQNRKEFSRYELAVKSFQVDLGLHLEKQFGKYSMGAFIASGPLFASFSHDKEWIWLEEKYVYISSRRERVFEQKGQEFMTGRGTGVAVLLGARLAREINSRLSLFIAVQEIWQNVFALKGTHELRVGDYQLKKQGMWTIGEIEYYDPESRTDKIVMFPEIEAGATKMQLNLSGLQLSLGLSLKL